MTISVPGGEAGPMLVVGPLSVDRYVASGDDLPGGGALNVAYHWSQLGQSFMLVSRVGEDHRDLFASFLDRHGIATTPIVRPGPSCSIDIRIEADRQPWMDNFVEGVWSSFRFTDDELRLIAAGTSTHLVLVDAVDREVQRRAADLTTARLSGDFLSFRHMSVERFASAAALLDVAFIGWPGELDDPLLNQLAECCTASATMLVLTFGARGVRVIEGATGRDQWFDVKAQPVTGTTVGCGDAFIAAFLADWHASGDVATAVAAGMRLGAAATAWDRPLPDTAYGA